MRLPRTLLLMCGSILALPALTSAAIIFQQDFSSSANVADYVNAGAGPENTTQFSELSTTGAGGSWSIVNGALVLDRTAVSTFSQTNVMRRSDMTASAVMSLQFDLAIVKNSTLSHDASLFYLGKDTVPYGGHDANRWTTFTVRGATSTKFNINNTGPQFDMNVSNTFRIYANNSAVAGAPQQLTYTGADGGEYTLGSDNYSLWINDVMVVNNAPNTQTGSTFQLLESFAWDWSKPDGASWRFDNFVARDDLALVPEPGATALLGMVGAGVLMRRRRRM